MRKCQFETLEMDNDMMFVVWAIKLIIEIQLEVTRSNYCAVFISSL